MPKDSFRKTLYALFSDMKVRIEDDAVLIELSPVEQRRVLFRRLLDENGIPYQDIGAHSYRKGSATYTASGSTAAPPIIAICLRAGWKLGGVLNTYLSLESAGDRFVGRVCALLPQVSKEFCVLPPRFPTDIKPADRKLIIEVMRAMFGQFNLYGPSFGCVLRHCLASLCFHQEWLTQLPSGHPWHASYLGLNPHITTKLRKLVGPLKFRR